MTWHYVVSTAKDGSDQVVHSKHRDVSAAQKRIAIKQKQFRTAGVERKIKIVEAEGWMLAIPSTLREIVVQDGFLV